MQGSAKPSEEEHTECLVPLATRRYLKPSSSHKLICAFVEIAEIEEKHGLLVEHSNVTATRVLEILPCLLRYNARGPAKPAIIYLDTTAL